MPPRRLALTGLAVFVVALVVFHLLAPAGPLSDASYLLAIWTGPFVAWIGTHLSPRGRRTVPALIAAGLTLSALGDLAWMIYTWIGQEPDVSLADIPYGLSYFGLCGAVLIVATMRRRDGVRPARLDPDALIDALTVVVIFVQLFWTFTISGLVRDSSMPAGTRLVWATYPVADAVLLALVLRTIAVRRSRTAMGSPFVLGVCAWLGADLGYYVLQVGTDVSTLLDAGWMTGSVLMAIATLRPLAAPRPESATERQLHPVYGRLGIAVLPLLVPPVLLLVEGLVGGTVRPTSAMVGMVALVALTFARMARLLHSEESARADLAAARDAALAGSRAKSEFLATMSHEIRTPMNGVIGLTELLSATPLDERQQEYAAGLRTAGSALLTVINDILDFSKIEAGRLDLESTVFDPQQVLEEAVGLVAESALEKRLELLGYCSPDLPAHLRGDPVRVRQVLLNLASNAVKFTSSGEVLVRALVESRTPEEVVVRFEVTDTGIGLAEGDRDRLFDPFSQADSSTTRRFGGTGLGLAICRQLVDAMGGSIGVESDLGRGSTFWFRLPFRLEATSEPVTPVEGDLSGRRMLVVDDNRTNRMILHDQLGSWGVEVDLAESGREALALLDDAHDAGTAYDLAVLDLCMPELDGLGLARRIGSRPDCASLGMVLLTSGGDVTREDAEAAGITTRMTKPVQLSRLRAALLETIDAAPRGRPAAPARTAPPRSAPRFARGRVLVVEDGEINQIVAEGLLHGLGFEVELADDGHAALAAMERTTYQAVLMDVQMPGMDGLETTRVLRQREGVEYTPVIAMTASALPSDRERCLAAGMDDYVSKPISPDELGRTLDRWVPAS